MFLFFFLTFVTQAQTIWCDMDRKYPVRQTDPLYQQFLARIGDADLQNEIKPRAVSFLPVVIHVVARNENQHISTAQALHQIDVLNADFEGQGENTGKVSEEFKSLIANTDIRFCLATLDPDGQPTSGVTFTRTDIKDIALKTGPGGRVLIHYNELGGKTGWDPTRYINIWVGEYGGFLGSASFPGMAAFSEEIGLILDLRFFGSIGDAGLSGVYGRGHTLTHEMGHFLGLKHIWGDEAIEDCNDSDDISDTPNAAGPHFDCPTGSQESCGSNDMYQNFMDLTDDRCLAAFTPGQAQRMQAVIALFYPEIPVEGSCYSYNYSLEEWSKDLKWAYDAVSNKYVIYSNIGFIGNKHIKLYTIDGKLIRDEKWDDRLSYLLDFSNVYAGIYIVIITNGTERDVRKIVVF